jgi:hypothetical protein
MVTFLVKVSFQFRSEAFKLEVGQAGSCDFDSVSLFEVVDGVSVAIGRPFCGYEGPKALVSTTNNVVSLKFKLIRSSLFQEKV